MADYKSLEEFYSSNGYIHLKKIEKTAYNYNQLENFESELLKKLSEENLKKLPGYLMGNLNFSPGKFGIDVWNNLLQKEINIIFKNILKEDLNDYEIVYGGNINFPKGGKQYFHMDGNFVPKRYIVHFATSDITFLNGPTEILLSSHKKWLPFWKILFSKLKKRKLTMKKGDILLRPNILWHRGTKNNSEKPRPILTFILTKKKSENSYSEKNNNIFFYKNIFNEGFKGKFVEFIYVKLGILFLVYRFFRSFFVKHGRYS